MRTDKREDIMSRPIWGKLMGNLVVVVDKEYIIEMFFFVNKQA